MRRPEPLVEEYEIEEISAFPQNHQWVKEKQPDPPNFGEAKQVSWLRLSWEVRRRRSKCLAIIRDSYRYCRHEPGLVSLIILSCKRPAQLRRLCDSLVSFFKSVETTARVEWMLLDNGSGPDVVEYASSLNCFHQIIAHPRNIGMVGALRDGFSRCHGEYILLIEDDFVLDYSRPFISRCLEIFAEFPEIGIIRLKNQNNWWKPFRRIAPLRQTTSGTAFWTWLPSRDGTLNGWASGSVLFRKVSYFSTGPLPEGPNLTRDEHPLEHQGYLYECVYGRRYNKTWLAAKINGGCPFVQPNDNPDSSGWGEL